MYGGKDTEPIVSSVVPVIVLVFGTFLNPDVRDKYYGGARSHSNPVVY